MRIHALPERNPRHDVWDALTAHFGEPRTKTERTMFGRVAAELLEAGANMEETKKACEYVLANFDSPSVNAVPKWFSVAQKQRKPVVDGKLCPSCGVVVRPPNTMADHLDLHDECRTAS